ncbi:MAG: MlaD family protein [Kiritimatiellae bacterium]|nr:MlaD family protein [Kiritimatiellia bacterium]
MSGKRKDAFSEAIVGVFMLAVLALLVYFTIVISGVDVLHGQKRVKVAVTFADVGGLKDHDNVMYRGTKVGSVDRIELSPDELKVVMEIDRGVVLREGYRISVCDLSMLGGHYLLLEEGTGEPLSLESTLFAGESPVDFGRSVTKVVRRLDEVLSDPKITNIVAKVDSAAEDVSAVVADVRAGKGTVGKLLSPDETLYSEMKSAVSGANTAMTNLAEIATGMREGKGTAGKLLADDTVYNDLQRTLSSAADIAERLRNGEGLAGRLLAKDDPIYGELDAAVKAFRSACESFDAKDAMDGAEKLVANLNVIVERLKNGEGSAGKLLADDDLYNEIEGLMKDARQVLDNFRDTTPISTFGSLVTGGL